MGNGYFVRNIQAQSEAFSVLRNGAAVEGWNRCSRAAAGIGSPWLDTQSSKVSASLTALTLIGSPLAPYVRALPSKFEKSCVIRAGHISLARSAKTAC